MRELNFDSHGHLQCLRGHMRGNPRHRISALTVNKSSYQRPHQHNEVSVCSPLKARLRPSRTDGHVPGASASAHSRQRCARLAGNRGSTSTPGLSATQRSVLHLSGTDRFMPFTSHPSRLLHARACALTNHMPPANPYDCIATQRSTTAAPF